MEGMDSDQYLPIGEEWFLYERGLGSGSREGSCVGEGENLENRTLICLPCFAGQRHPTSSMMETMTMTRKATWRFKSSWACFVLRNSFLPLVWAGGKRCGTSSSDGHLLGFYQCWKRVWRPHLVFEPMSPFLFFPRPDNGTY